MSEQIVNEALAYWGLENCAFKLIATRENHVYRVSTSNGFRAFRRHRNAYRSKLQLRSELDWMAALYAAGLRLPQPIPAQNGEFCVEVGGSQFDMLTWIDAIPLGEAGNLAEGVDRQTFSQLGRLLAQLHHVSDVWKPPADFDRPSWDLEGLVGEKPLWGRFWENTQMSDGQSALLRAARESAKHKLSQTRSRDYGLIHADAVPENVLIGREGLTLIDFDDGGFGFRLFDLATALNRLDRHDPTGGFGQALVNGYLASRQIDFVELSLFRLLRSLTYVGWIIPRLAEPGAKQRCERFIQEACDHAERFVNDERCTDA